MIGKILETVVEIVNSAPAPREGWGFSEEARSTEHNRIAHLLYDAMISEKLGLLVKEPPPKEMK